MSDAFFNTFLDKLPQTEDDQFDDAFREIDDAFYKMFGHRAPLEMLPGGIDTEQIKNAMKICIENKEDNLLKLLHIETDKDALV